MGLQQVIPQNSYKIDRPFNTREAAEYFIRFVKNTTYGSGIKEPVTRFNNADFHVTESDGKFYVNYKPL